MGAEAPVIFKHFISCWTVCKMFFEKCWLLISFSFSGNFQTVSANGSILVLLKIQLISWVPTFFFAKKKCFEIFSESALFYLVPCAWKRSETRSSMIISTLKWHLGVGWPLEGPTSLCQAIHPSPCLQAGLRKWAGSLKMKWIRFRKRLPQAL